jgi:hypothetical protein
MEVSFEDWRDAISLISCYARSVDALDTPGVLGCFTDDVTLSFESGNRVLSGSAAAHDFYHGVHAGKSVPSTHLLSNYGLERAGSAIVARCSAIVCSCRKEGFVTMKGLVYAFTCVRDGADLRIQKFEHASTWECEAPGGRSTMAWLGDKRAQPVPPQN